MSEIHYALAVRNMVGAMAIEVSVKLILFTNLYSPFGLDSGKS